MIIQHEMRGCKCQHMKLKEIRIMLFASSDSTELVIDNSQHNIIIPDQRPYDAREEQYKNSST